MIARTPWSLVRDIAAKRAPSARGEAASSLAPLAEKPAAMAKATSRIAFISLPISRRSVSRLDWHERKANSEEDGPDIYIFQNRCPKATPHSGSIDPFGSGASRDCPYPCLLGQALSPNSIGSDLTLRESENPSVGAEAGLSG